MTHTGKVGTQKKNNGLPCVHISNRYGADGSSCVLIINAHVKGRLLGNAMVCMCVHIIAGYKAGLAPFCVFITAHHRWGWARNVLLVLPQWD